MCQQAHNRNKIVEKPMSVFYEVETSAECKEVYTVDRVFQGWFSHNQSCLPPRTGRALGVRDEVLAAVKGCPVMIDPQVIKSLMTECKHSSIPPGLYAHTSLEWGICRRVGRWNQQRHEAVYAEYDLMEKMHHVNRWRRSMSGLRNWWPGWTSA